MKLVIRDLWFLLVFCLASQSLAFLPSRAGVTLPDTDYTLTEITEQGIVRAVAKYFEETNPDRYSPGDLTGLSPLTPSRLFRKHYGDCVYSTKFERAVEAISDANIDISNVYANKAVWHFNGNQINAGNRKMIGIRNTLLNTLTSGDENAPNYDTARRLSGQFLHMAQSFYSNTNWVELTNLLRNSAAGEDENEVMTARYLGIILNPMFPRESPEEADMCRNCEPFSTNSLLGPQDCSDNLVPFLVFLTSGYRSEQDVLKPAAPPGSVRGKCSHGGLHDASRTKIATGGINKESSDRQRSPHFHLHEQAALMAIQATEDFFYHPATGLYQHIGEQKFRQLLDLDKGTSLTFVIDVSGSMSDEINSVKEETIRLVRLHSETCLAASKYVVAPFSDPGYGPALVTTNAQRCIEYLSSLTAGSGGDCPELANSGLELGVQNSINGANVYLFTDASDKDGEKLPDVLALIEEKQVRVNYLLTGTCSSRRRRRAIDRSSLPPSYQIIAEASGGEIYQTDNRGISDLVRIIEGDIRASQVTITQRSSLNLNAVNINIPVDSTIQEVLVSVVGILSGDSVIIEHPSGTEGTPAELRAAVYTNSAEQIVFSINVTEPDTKGAWVVKLRNLNLATEYYIKVSANSVLDFTFDILETDETGTAYPVDGKPVAGAEVLLTVQVSAPETVSSVSEIKLYNANGNEMLVTASATPVMGRTEGLFIANISLPNEPFFVSIVGEDTQGMEFLRTQPSEIKVVEFKLEEVLGSNTVDDLVPGGNSSFAFRVTNNGPSDRMTVTVSVLDTAVNSSASTLADVSGPVVTAAVKPAIMVLGTGDMGDGLVIVTAAKDAPAGTSVKVTLSVESSLSLALNFLSIDATVFAVENDTYENPDENDDTPPSCEILSSGGGCTAQQMSSNCHEHEWWVRAQATDNSILTEVVPDSEIENNGTGKQLFVYERFLPTNMTLKYSATCCCPIMKFTVRDGAGNQASCGQDYYTAVAGEVEKPQCNGPVLESLDDNIPPTCRVLSTGGGCTAEQMSSDCHKHEWWVLARATDNSNVTVVVLDPEIEIDGTGKQWLVYENILPANVTFGYSATCCCPIMNFTVHDGAGNQASCGQDYYTALAGEVEKPQCNGPFSVLAVTHWHWPKHWCDCGHSCWLLGSTGHHGSCGLLRGQAFIWSGRKGYP
ncbi:von Willebrand factor A domain-containing protein 7-like isoform X2 [Acanthaster planci]|uniref:von Willebrand factor A domain-containing protein 7-like isoform X2 n=1 Tax=Acanthaster planci TaxID=133434 RepID=A0A8B7ZVK6_ACAPL|nr:von Willebrand factor A domain-containing protein 7-like isoform X2 [Acanthaster planci]